MSRIPTLAQLSGTSENTSRWYDDYANMPADLFLARVDALLARYSPAPTDKFLVAGSGGGYLVAELNARGVSTWGIDASPDMVALAQAKYPALAGRFLLGSCTVRTDLNAARTAAGITGNRRFDATVTEDLLPCMDTEQELATCLSELRRVSTRLIHLITCLHPTTRPAAGIIPLWRTHSQWRALIGTGETILDCENAPPLVEVP